VDEVTDEKVVNEVVGRLKVRFPSVNADTIMARVKESLQSFTNAPIRDFLPVLVERRVTRALTPVGFQG
jgi:hypothetical protein